MKKILVSNLVSLDGYFEGPNRELDWHVMTHDFHAYSVDFLNATGALLFGRITYQLMASYWPKADTISSDPAVAEKMNSLPKYVCSNTLKSVDWEHSTLIKGDALEEIRRLKNQTGGDLMILGSGTLVNLLTQHGLIDEYRIIINPVLLGKGNSMFKGLNQRLNLELEDLKRLESGKLICYYRPKKNKN
jgi:dihydrofolate reductase